MATSFHLIESFLSVNENSRQKHHPVYSRNQLVSSECLYLETRQNEADFTPLEQSKKIPSNHIDRFFFLVLKNRLKMLKVQKDFPV